MATLDTLETALALLTSSDPQSVKTQTWSAEHLSPTEQRRLQQQTMMPRVWDLDQNIAGYGIADKQSGAGSTGELALTIYVKQKYPRDVLSSAQTVPSLVELEGLPEQVPTDIREIGPLQFEALSSKVRPIVGGYSIGRQSDTGTFGCLVVARDAKDQYFLLGNSHIFAAAGTGQPGDPIYHPGPGENNATMEVVANLASWQPFDFSADYSNRIDAALAKPVDATWFDATIFDVGKPKGIRPVERGKMIQKSGRTTGHTWGRVVDVHFRLRLEYPRPDGSGTGSIGFVDQVLCTRYTAPGDSGALVLDADGYAVGLHFCGAPAGSVFSPISFVLDDLGIDLVL